MNPFLFTLFAFVITLLITPAVKRLAVLLGCMDVPGEYRKIHTKPIPLLGGLAVFFGFFGGLSLYLLFGHHNFTLLPAKFFIGITLGAVLLMIGGLLDDRYSLPPRWLWVFPALAAVSIVQSGIGVGITFITSPFGGVIPLTFSVAGLPASALFIWLWMMGMMFTTKFLDGLDGLASGIGAIASLSLFFLSLTSKVHQPTTATLALMLCGALVGFLVYNFNPASIFLGEAGSTFIGFMLGVLSVILGGKIATALLVMGLPVLDVAWVIVRRIWEGKSPFKADRKHLHFRLLDVGLSQKQTVLSIWTLAAVFGFTAVFLQTYGKALALLLLGIVVFILGSVVVYLDKVMRGKNKKNPSV